MGANSSRIEVYYTFKGTDPKELMEKCTRKLLKGAHITLKPLPGDGASAVIMLVFRDCPEPSLMHDFFRESLQLRQNELMVVLTPEINREYCSTESMVQLVYSRTKSKGRSIDVSETNSRTIHTIKDFIVIGGRPSGGYRTYSSNSSRQLTESQKAAAAAATVEEERDVPEVHMAYGDRVDTVLKNAVHFVQRECQLVLVESPNIHRSTPLLVFCKNDTKLQEDIRHATESTRGGTDVMLLVLTDRRELVLTDTQATQNFGAKGCLLFDQIRQKFGYSDNLKILRWIKKFLARYHIDVSLRMRRSSSFRNSLTRIGKSPESGYYLVLGELSEEHVKNIVLFFDDLNVSLIETPREQSVTPLVLLCAASHNPDQLFHTYHQSHHDFQNVFTVIVQWNSEELPFLRAFSHDSYGRLAIKDGSVTVLSNAQNKRLVDTVRKFLRRHTAPSQRRSISLSEKLTNKPESSDSGVPGSLYPSTHAGPSDPDGTEVHIENMRDMCMLFEHTDIREADYSSPFPRLPWMQIPQNSELECRPNAVKQLLAVFEPSTSSLSKQNDLSDTRPLKEDYDMGSPLTYQLPSPDLLFSQLAQSGRGRTSVIPSSPERSNSQEDSWPTFKEDAVFLGTAERSEVPVQAPNRDSWARRRRRQVRPALSQLSQAGQGSSWTPALAGSTET